MSNFEELIDHMKQDAMLLGQLNEMGDDASTEHDLEHCVLGSDEKTIKRFSKIVEGLGFVPGEIDEDPDEESSFIFVFTSKRTLAPSSGIIRESLLLKLLAEALDLEYDGWGTHASTPE